VTMINVFTNNNNAKDAADYKCACEGLREWAHRRRTLKQEAFLEWLYDQTQGMSDASLERAVTRSLTSLGQMMSADDDSENSDERNNEVLKPSEAVLEEYFVKLSFEKWLSQKEIHHPERIVHTLNSLLESMHLRTLLGDFHLDLPYERFVRIKKRLELHDKLREERRTREHQCYQHHDFQLEEEEEGKKHNFDNNTVLVKDEHGSFKEQVQLRDLIAEESRMKRAALEEKCYVRILLSRGLQPAKVIDAVENFWDTGDLLISEAELENAVEIEYMMDLRRVRKMVGVAENMDSALY
jgi:hypothetical protein